MKTLGDHIRKRRTELGLLQREVAERMGVNPCTIVNWEGNATDPELRFLPMIIRFLGYSPFPPAMTLAERLVLYRKLQGLSQKKFAKQLGIDSSTLAVWERGRRNPTGRLLEKVKRLVASRRGRARCR